MYICIERIYYKNNMEQFDVATLRCRCLSNDEIDAANVERLGQRLEQINSAIDRFNFRMMIHGGDCLYESEKAKYEKLLAQKEWIENKLNAQK